MSYTIEDLTSIDDAIFDTLWLDSFPRIESGGTMPWSKYEVHYGHALTEEEKKEILYLEFSNAIEDPGPELKVLLTRKDGIPVRMMNWRYNLDEGIAHGYYQLLGPDANGSRGWLFDPELLQQLQDLFISEFGATAHTGMVVTGSPIHNYYVTRDVGGVLAEMTSVDNDGISTLTFTYTGE